MKCEDCQQILSAWLDGELPSGEASSVSHHVEHCEDCSARVSELQVLDVQFKGLVHPELPGEDFLHRVQRSFTDHPRLNSERVAKEGSNPAKELNRNRSWSRWQDVFWLTSLATCLLIGFFLGSMRGSAPQFAMSDFHNGSELVDPPNASSVTDERDGQVLVESKPIAKIWFATAGDVEVSAPDSINFYSCPIRSDLAQGSRMRTRAEKCEFRTSSGATIRMDIDTEVALEDADKLVLEKGRICLVVPSDTAESGMVVKCGPAAIEVTGGVCDVQSDQESTQLIPLEGEAQFSCGNFGSSVAVGQRLAFAEGNEPEIESSLNPIVETRWLHDILTANTDAAQELEQRVNRILAELGYSKLTNLWEDELRNLGSKSVDPLIAFLLSEESKHQGIRHRGIAAVLVRDLADASHVPKLVNLLDDEDETVRFAAAAALKRLLGRNLAATPEQWRDSESEKRQSWMTSYAELVEKRYSPEK